MLRWTRLVLDLCTAGSGARQVKKVQPVLGGFDSTQYTTERLWATSHDGTQVPMSVVYRCVLLP